MGWGDEIIASGEARRIYSGRKIAIKDLKNRHRWSPVWEGNPIIARPEEVGIFQIMVNAGGARLYIDYERMRDDFRRVHPNLKMRAKFRDVRLPYRFNDWNSARGEIHFTERQKPQYIVIEPHYKPNQPNRDWGFDKWQAVVDKLDLPWVQINRRGARILNGARYIPADNFVDACRLLASAALYVGPEGGLYHAAGAFRIPSVAIFGGFVSPKNQGYKESINIYDPKGSPCGQRVPCGHCNRILENIKPQDIISAIERKMNEDRMLQAV